MASQYDNQMVRRRLQFIDNHMGARIGEHAISSINSIGCSSTFKLQSRRRDSMLLFARQGSETYSHFMRQDSVKQVTPIEDENDKLSIPMSALGSLSKDDSPSPCNLLEELQTGIPLFGKPVTQQHEKAKSNSVDNESKDAQQSNDFAAEEAPLFARAPLSTGKKSKHASSVNHHKHCEDPIRKPKGPEWVPRMDVLESGTEYVLLVELPGVLVEGIRVEVDHGRLIVTGTRSSEWWKTFGSELAVSTTAEHALYHQQDLAYGPYRTVWRLPENVDMNAISAEFINGVLMVLIPKLKSSTSH
ncbi:hypothetical protein O6H91_08G047300 [Diphasiastrum complanatum]|uniref:Uncharacterized protein n=3 Tax=Diphasiastrum complanatum TaxID=34168 RepID=A0ACC2CX80_DIPCM|nr:hypothetical protein O6H91_Y068600 [Diphasiastrum complanatum]KAJ7297265.1 hypothetical protein O6H91_Y068600 [Diphasiastrum complanatum]KAJ7297267.1 hypothetical protein O6H91_Y068600 [Diphasiastrum complanatum]KAJ7546622.1 hypothetical protein O6H91_08G047300 [Diphasiastrum complanatum]KAJ7546623.1 hypothetical protein O6H91_08G047300 [Diphasiastrum complanatum]